MLSKLLRWVPVYTKTSECTLYFECQILFDIHPINPKVWRSYEQ